MEAFDKKKAFSIGGILTVVAAIIAVAANISEIIQLFRGDDKPESSVAVVETVDKNIEEPVIEQAESNYNIAEVIESVGVIEQEEILTVFEPTNVYINELDYMSCENHVKEQDNLKDNVGNMYHKGLFMCRDLRTPGGLITYWYGGGSADYYIQGKYKTFSGIVAVPSGNENNTRSAFFEIYGDGNLLYTSPVMSNTSFPENFSIDITDVQLLTISYPESNEEDEMATLYDGLLS